MQNTPRVSAFGPGMVLLVWWPVDIALALMGITARWVRVQRIVLHVAVIILFVGGSAVTGELMVVKALGVALFAVALVEAISNRRGAAHE